MANSFLSNSMGWTRKSSLADDKTPQEKQKEKTEDEVEEVKTLKRQIKVLSRSPTPSTHKHNYNDIKTFWSFDLATTSAMRTLQKRPLVPKLSSYKVPSNGSRLCSPSFLALGRPPVEEWEEDLALIEAESEIFNEEDFHRLRKELPKRLLGSNWLRSFCTSRDGFSLATIYRRMSSHLSRPALLLIRDTNGHRFGAFVSEAFHVKEKSFGSGESFVFRIKDDGEEGLQIWKWTCKNDFFVLCSNSSLCIGIDDGKFSLYLDESLYQGRSQKCQTFDNEPLTPTGDFQASAVEVWNFE